MTTEIVHEKDRREGKGRVIAISRTIYRITNTDVFYVESESKDGMYYYVMFDTAKKFEWCSCKDFERRNNMCKHLYAVSFAIKMNTVKDTEKLPPAAKKSKGYEEDEYDF